MILLLNQYHCKIKIKGNKKQLKKLYNIFSISDFNSIIPTFNESNYKLLFALDYINVKIKNIRFYKKANSICNDYNTNINDLLISIYDNLKEGKSFRCEDIYNYLNLNNFSELILYLLNQKPIDLIDKREIINYNIYHCNNINIKWLPDIYDIDLSNKNLVIELQAIDKPKILCMYLSIIFDVIITIDYCEFDIGFCGKAKYKYGKEISNNYFNNCNYIDLLWFYKYDKISNIDSIIAMFIIEKQSLINNYSDKLDTIDFLNKMNLMPYDIKKKVICKINQ